MAGSLFRTKSIDQIMASHDGGEVTLKRTLGAGALVALGIGAIIGAFLITSLPLILRPLAEWRDVVNGALLIVVTVTMDTVAQIQSHLLAHQYEGLIKKSKLRGRNG